MTSVMVEFKHRTSPWDGREATPIATIINSNGEIAFPEYSMEYEIAFCAMGGDKTPQLTLFERWNKNPITVLVEFASDIPVLVRQRWLIDSAESVIYILEKRNGRDFGIFARKIIDQCRLVLNTKKEGQRVIEIKAVREMMNKFILMYHDVLAVHNLACGYVIDSIESACEMLNTRITYSSMSSHAAADDAVSMVPDDHCLWVAAWNKQQEWELNRFIELMVELAPERVVTP